MISCVCDCVPEYFVNLSDPLVVSVGTEFCVECGRLIPFGEEHYMVRECEYSEDGDKTEKGVHTCCESCGDLALSVFAAGFCWEYGTLRDCIAEMNA